MNKRFDDILDICLDRIIMKGNSIEQCLQSYPEQAAELEPLLRAALSIKEVSSIKPRPEFEKAAKHRLLSTLEAKERKTFERRAPFWRWQRRWALALAMILVFVIIGSGTVAASMDSLPGDTFYPVKTATEKVQTFFTLGDEAKANLHIKFAQRRIRELESLSEAKRDIPQSLLNRMRAETEGAIEILDRNEVARKRLVAKLLGLTSDQRGVLAKAIEKVPPETKVKLLPALRRSEEAHGRAVLVREKIPEPGRRK